MKKARAKRVEGEKRPYKKSDYVKASLMPFDPDKPKRKSDAKYLPAEYFAVLDIESYDWDQLVMVGLFDGDAFEWHKTMSGVLDSLFMREQRMAVYMHFGGGFDMKFVLQEIFQPKDGKPTNYVAENMIPIGSSCTFLSFDVRVKGTEGPIITFYDSFRFLPMALKAINKCFKTPHVKLDYDLNEIAPDSVTPLLIEYNENDCRSLYEAIEIYRKHDLVREVGFRSTVGSQAMAIFRRFLKEPIKPCYQCRERFIETKLLPNGRVLPKETESQYQVNIFKHDWFIRGQSRPAIRDNEGKESEPAIDIKPAYYGGRTEVFQMYFDGPGLLNYYDVNSMYPAVMLANLFPHEFIGRAKRFLPKQLGFWDVTVEIPTPDQDERFWIPPLGLAMKTTSTDKFIFPCGTVRGKWSTAEINHALSLGVKLLKVHQGELYSSAGELFTEFVTTIYKRRLKAKAEGDTVTETICKNILNSCYGRFGINPWREQLEFFVWKDKQKPLEYWFDTPEGRQMMCKVETLVPVFSNVAIASYVTAYARILLHKALLATKGSIWYCDTDSLVTAQELPTSDALGHLKLEGRVVQGSWILPKGYSMIFEKPMKPDDPSSIKQTKIKGMDKKRLEFYDPFDLSENAKGMFNLKLYESDEGSSKKMCDAIRRSVKEISTLSCDRDKDGNPKLDANGQVKGRGLKGLTRALSQDHTFAVRDQPMYRRIQSLYDKRKVLHNEKGSLTTTPWILNSEGEIINGYARDAADKRKSQDAMRERFA